MSLDSPIRDGRGREDSEPARAIYRFGEFVLSLSDHRLSRNGDHIPLRPKSFDVLVLLVRNHGHLVTREDLLAAVWPDTHVTEQILSHSIWEVRRALESVRDPSRYIRTVPRRGYEFVADVTESMPDAADTRTTGPGHALRHLAAGGVLVAGLAVSLAWWAARQGPEGAILQPVPLTTDPGFETWPTFSPDGGRVAFQRTVEGEDAIFVKRIGEEAAVRRTFGPGLDHAPSWSPDGRWIAFLRAGHPFEGPLRLMVVPPAAGAQREIARLDVPVAWGFRPTWTQDSRSLIVPDREGPSLTYALYRISIDGGGRARLTLPDEGSVGEGDKDPAVSPDGTRLAFSINGDLHVVGLDGQHQPSDRPRKLAGGAQLGGLWGLAWTADSQEVVFAAGQWPQARLFRVAAPGGQARPLPSVSAGAFAPAVSATGRRLAYMEWITGADIWQVQLDDGENVASEPARLIGSSRLDAHPVYSPDGARIAFHSDRTGGQGIWIASASGEGAHRLELLGRGGSPLTPDPGFCWSPDQTAIVFAVEGDLHVVNVRSERSQPLTSGPVVDQSPAWSPDGRWVYYSSFQQGLWRVARVPARGGPPVQLTKDGGRLLAVSPDGLRVYFANDDQLWTIPAGGGEPVQILAVAPDAAVATERGLFYALNVPAHSIRYLDIESRTSKTVTELDRWIMGLSVSPDGRDLVYGLLDHKRADLMLVEGFE